MGNLEMAYLDTHYSYYTECSQLKLSVSKEIQSPGSLLAAVLDELSELNVLN